MQNIKEELLAVCKEAQQKTIENLKKVVEDAQKSANDYGTPKDRYDSFRTQMLRKRDMFAQHLQKANEQLDVLNMIDSSVKMDSVEFGTLVITEDQKLFISISLGKVILGQDEYYAISPLVPVFAAIEGKKIGETYEFKGMAFKIIDIL
jgi:hypothetical protein